MRLLVVLMHNERWRQYTWGREKYFVMCDVTSELLKAIFGLLMLAAIPVSEHNNEQSISLRFQYATSEVLKGL